MSVCLPNSSASKRHRQPGDEEVPENNTNVIEEEADDVDKQTELAIMESLKMYEAAEADKNSMVT